MADCSVLQNSPKLMLKFTFFFPFLTFKNTHLALFFFKYIVYKIRQLEETKRASPLLRYCSPATQSQYFQLRQAVPSSHKAPAHERRGATCSEDAVNGGECLGTALSTPSTCPEEGKALIPLGVVAKELLLPGMLQQEPRGEHPISRGIQGQRQHRRWNDLISPQN